MSFHFLTNDFHSKIFGLCLLTIMQMYFHIFFSTSRVTVHLIHLLLQHFYFYSRLTIKTQFLLIAYIIEHESNLETLSIFIEFFSRSFPNGFMDGKMASHEAMIYSLLKIISETVGLFIDFLSHQETWYINFRRWTFMTENNIKHRTLVKGKKS